MDASEWPYIEILSTPGDATTARRLPVRQYLSKDGDWRPERIGEQPSEGIPQPILLGNTEKRSNLDVSQIIFDDWRGGMGEDKYTETEGLRTFNNSECDTSYANVLTCPPLATQMGTLPFTPGTACRMLHLGLTAEVLFYNVGGNAAYYSAGSWTQFTAGGSQASDLYQIASGMTGAFGCASLGSATAYSVVRSTNGTTWADIYGSGLPSVGANLFHGIALHDNKVCLLQQDSATKRYVLYTSVDADTAASPTWLEREGFPYVAGAEAAIGLFNWQYPGAPSEPALWALTTRRMWYWDTYADVPAWKQFGRPFTTHGGTATGGGVFGVFPRTNNLYVANGPYIDYLYEYAGPNVEGIVSPNFRGGLPDGKRVAITHIEGNAHHLYAWGQIPSGDTASRGMVYKMNDEQGWHYVWDKAAAYVATGGLGPNKVYTALIDRTVWYQTVKDIGDNPLYATGNTYESGEKLHYSAYTDGGTPLLDKQALWFHVDCDIPTGAQLRVGYQERGGSVTWVQTLTPSDTLPAVVEIPGTSTWKELRLVLGLTRGTATSATVIVRSVGLNYVRLPKVRFGYVLRVIADGAALPYADDDEQKFGKWSATALRTWVRALAGAVVGLRFGGFGRSTDPRFTSVNRAMLSAVPQEDPESGEGELLLTFFDLSSPNSG